jgi:hypothetical protein
VWVIRTASAGMAHATSRCARPTLHSSAHPASCSAECAYVLRVEFDTIAKIEKEAN